MQLKYTKVMQLLSTRSAQLCSLCGLAKVCPQIMQLMKETLSEIHPGRGALVTNMLYMRYSM